MARTPSHKNKQHQHLHNYDNILLGHSNLSFYKYSQAKLPSEQKPIDRCESALFIIPRSQSDAVFIQKANG